MAGIYVHIPFCKQACHYCDFHFSTNTSRQKELLEAIASEAKMRQSYLEEAPIQTLYFGGGTPSILPADAIQKLTAAFQSTFACADRFEYTLEANPDDLNPEKLSALKTIGVNRLSIGIQSFLDSQLRWMNRAHNSEEALSCIADAHQQGFDNISIDLIYGLPNLSMEEWEAELNKALKLGIQHISAYCLTVESKTALGVWVKRGKEKAVDEEAAQAQFLRMVEILSLHGFEQYEVSNFALKGFESQHNRSYWQGTPYLGLGPAAHSFNGESRAWNIANNAQYSKKIEGQTLATTEEKLTRIDQVNEYLMTGLRTKWGVDLGRIETQLGQDFRTMQEVQIRELVSRDLASLEGDILRLTKKGLFFADGIASDFFILNHED